MSLPCLIDLSISLADENQVTSILTQFPNLMYLNGKSTKNELHDVQDLQQSLIIDLQDDEMQSISLENEIQIFNDIFKLISDKLKTINSHQNFKEDFQVIIKSEINKINSNYESVPNYIYVTNVLESQLSIYSFFYQKFITFLEMKDNDSTKLSKMINSNIAKSYLTLIKLIYKLYPKITEKTQALKDQLDEAIKSSQNANVIMNDNNINPKDINKLEEKDRQIKEKDILLVQYQEQILMLQSKVAQLENENKIMTEKVIKNAKNIINSNTDLSSKIYHVPNQSNNNLNININMNNNTNNNVNSYLINRKYSKEKVSLSNNPSNAYISSAVLNNNNKAPNSFYNNQQLQQINQPVCNRVFTIKMMKDIINEIYNSKGDYDKKSDENKLPRETLEQHMYTFLNQKYGLKQIIIEWATNIINGIKIFSSEDSEICLFGKVLRNEIEEDSRLVLNSLRPSLIEKVNYFLKVKYPLKSHQDILTMQSNRVNGTLSEEEWKYILNTSYDQQDTQFLENKIYDIIQKKFMKNKFETEKKLTREEIISLSQIKDEYSIPFKDLIKILQEFQIKTREKYLRNFVLLFKQFDSDNNGIINEEEFVNLVYHINYYGSNIKENVVRLLTLIDPYNNKQITFSECVSLFSTEAIKDDKKNVIGSLLDKICLE